MTSNHGRPLLPRISGDGSFSLYSPEFAEGFHSADGALGEARRVYVEPAQLDRFPRKSRLVVVDVGVGTGTNTAALIESIQKRELMMAWWGLEQDPLPSQLALDDPGFQAQWPQPVLSQLNQLIHGDTLLWGDARQRLADLQRFQAGHCDLVLLDAFSPRRCPQLWSQEFLRGLASLLTPQGRLITYCSAAAVRRSLITAGLRLSAICSPQGSGRWSAGTVASPTPLPDVPPLRPLTPMELEHLNTRAGEPYKDPGGCGTAEDILAARSLAQQGSRAESTSEWQRRWRLTDGAQ